MIIAKITGGLGNQLFQYAMARRLAIHRGAELLLDTTGFGANGETRPQELATFLRPLKLLQFNVQARTASAEEIAALKDDFYRATTRDRIVRKVRRIWPGWMWKPCHRLERQYRFQPEALDWPDNVYLEGYWQSAKYFTDIAPQLREELKLKDETLRESAQAAVQRLRDQHAVVVSLHVRRGDIAHAHETLGKKHMTHGAPVTTDYIGRAMARFEGDPCFFVFSDSPKDIEWCRKNIHAKHLEFSKAESDVWDFWAMSCCDHHIIANSTFSWWAAWLNPNPSKRVVAPRQWSAPESKTQMITDDLLPAEWETI